MMDKSRGKEKGVAGEGSWRRKSEVPTGQKGKNG